MKKTGRNLYRQRLLAIALPIIMNNIIAQLQMIIDRIFLAVLADEGVRALINLWKYLRIIKKWR